MRRFYRQVMALSVLAALAACDEARTPLAPADDGEPSQATEPATASADLGTLTTTARIAFESWNAVERADIWTVDPQGTGYVHLTSTAGSEYSPAWSYDHKRVAFVRPRLDANKVWHNDIYVMNADGTNKHWARSATSTSDIDNPAWSPDGTRLVVTARPQGLSVVATLDLSTGSLVTVAPKGMFGVQGYKASYDPAGKSILYLDSQANKIHRFVPGGDDKVLLTADRTIVNATFSPDGTKVAYSRYVSDNNIEVFVLTLATGISKRLTTNGAVDVAPTWSPDGTKLAFSSNRSGSYQIWTMNAATGGSLTRVTNVINASDPAWWH